MMGIDYLIQGVSSEGARANPLLAVEYPSDRGRDHCLHPLGGLTIARLAIPSTGWAEALPL